MPAASANLGQLRYIQETTSGVTPTTGNGVELRTLQPTMKAAIATIKSAEINKYRMVRSSTNSDLTVDGGFEFELSAKEYDPFIQGILFGTFTHYGRWCRHCVQCDHHRQQDYGCSRTYWHVCVHHAGQRLVVQADSARWRLCSAETVLCRRLVQGG